MPRCEDEAIHIPGLIQAHGALLVVQAAAHRAVQAEQAVLTHVSHNVAEFLAPDSVDLLGRTLCDVLASRAEHKLLAALANLEEGGSVFVPAAIAGPKPDTRLDVLCSRRGGQVLLELEFAGRPAHAEPASPAQLAGDERPLNPPLAPQAPAPASLDLRGAPGAPALNAEEPSTRALGLAEPELTSTRLLSALHKSTAQLIASKDSTELCQQLVQEVRACFRYDRVLVYRFDEQWNGTVIAEARSPHVTSYFGHQFPASDIPPQARAIFLQNMQRMIADVRAKPAGLVAHQSAAAPVDMTLCQLRSPSAIHLEYLRNLQVGASLTLSLRTGKTLWGLVACHHEKPRYLNLEQRHAAEVLAMLASSLLEQKLQQDNLDLAARLKQVTTTLAAQMQQNEDVLAALCDGPTTLLDMSLDEHASCAVCLNGQWRVLGEAPVPTFCAELVQWLDEQVGARDLFATSRLGHAWQAAEGQATWASGLLAISLPHGPSSYILWFRPELLREVIWAGNPKENKTQAGSKSSYLHPRQSFARYREIVRGHSRPVAQVEIQAALELRKLLIEVDLAHKVAQEQQLRAHAEAERRRAEQAVALREHVLGVVSHDLRNPLNAITLSAELMHRKMSKAAGPALLDAQQRFLHKVDTATKRMQRLIEDVLSLSAFQGGSLKVEQAPLSGQALLEETRSLLEPIAGKREQCIEVVAEKGDVLVNGDHERLLQALGNLVSNAVKFTPKGGHITMRIAPAPDGQEALFCVADTGRGIAKEDQARIFDTYWQAPGSEAKLGAGLGLSIVKQIVEAHGGRVWVDSAIGQGAEMWFSCPTAAADEPFTDLTNGNDRRTV